MLLCGLNDSYEKFLILPELHVRIEITLSFFELFKYLVANCECSSCSCIIWF